ncbi:hypothetical protein MSAN_01891800 [Mycena sanguinolenta]|uniref:Uncharacterized protein n=1 Tax=Mycena sanguinolenta TaxID=230812 RepID=A0A8H6XRJ0_9AGAR|nr:hypothetical protein MSAN_01891800 [Mycena sanguinolenta]
MPLSPPITADRVLEYTTVAANALQDVATAARIPFISRVCTVTLGIIPMIQNTRFQKDRCLRIMDDAHHLLCTLVALCSESEDIQSVATFEQVAHYAT